MYIFTMHTYILTYVYSPLSSPLFPPPLILPFLFHLISCRIHTLPTLYPKHLSPPLAPNPARHPTCSTVIAV